MKERAVPADSLDYRCPRCGGKDIRPSWQSGVFDGIMKLFRRLPYRCRSCRRRFFRYTRPKDQSSEEEDTHSSNAAPPKVG